MPPKSKYKGQRGLCFVILSFSYKGGHTHSTDIGIIMMAHKSKYKGQGGLCFVILSFSYEGGHTHRHNDAASQIKI